MNTIVGQQAWLSARRALLEEEKALTQALQALAKRRRQLPWVEIDKPYQFTGEAGQAKLEDLFAGRSQLLIYHFMFGPDWDSGCPSCSFWADNFNGLTPHFAQRDMSFAVVSLAPIAKLLNYRERMGWQFPWYSSEHSDFNYDFGVSFTTEQLTSGAANYNFGTQFFNGSEAPGVSVFKHEEGKIYHTYSCYARGLELLNSAYQHLDLCPKGRDEDGLAYPMAWLRRHDEYSD